MRFKKIFGVIALTIMLVLSVASSAFADAPEPVQQGESVPIGYVTAPDGHRIPMYLLPEDVRLTRSALAAGIVTKEQVEASRAVYQSLMAATNGRATCPWGGTRIISQGTCPWGGTAATLISEGWDADDDYYKDYEHPVGWTDDFVCMTAFYWAWTRGAGPEHEYHFDYKPGIARHRLKIGLTGFPGWFCSLQANMRWDH